MVLLLAPEGHAAGGWIDRAVLTVVRKLHRLMGVEGRTEGGHCVVVADDPDDSWFDELPPLVRAAAVGDLVAVQALLEAGCPVEESDGDGWTALHASAARGHAEVVALILHAGAAVDAETSDGFTPLLNSAGSTSSTEVIQRLIDAGANVNAADLRCGWTPLHRASEHSRPEQVSALLRAGADVSKVDRSGATALLTAAESGCTEVVELLVAAGADCAEVVDGESAADLARRQGHLDLARFLEDCSTSTRAGSDST